MRWSLVFFSFCTRLDGVTTLSVAHHSVLDRLSLPVRLTSTKALGLAEHVQILGIAPFRRCLLDAPPIQDKPVASTAHDSLILLRDLMSSSKMLCKMDAL